MASPLLFLLLVPAVLALACVAALHYIIRPGRVKIPIKGRHVFITGGSSGIGLAMARQAAAEGARVSILARDRSKLEAAREEIRRTTGAEVAVYSADVRDAGAVREAVQAAGTIDVLVCNQGVSLAQELSEQELEDAKFQIDVNLMGTLHLVKSALPAMKEAAAADGLPRSIAFTTSVGGQVGIYGYSAYCASNFAIRGLAESLQMELIGDNIHLSLILPGDTDTPGGAEGMRTRPKISSMIAKTAGFLTADDVARKALNGIKSGKFTINTTFDMVMLCLGTAGYSPQRSPSMAFAEVVGAGFMRFVALCYLSVWYKIVEEHAPRMQKRKEN